MASAGPVLKGGPALLPTVQRGEEFISGWSFLSFGLSAFLPKAESELKLGLSCLVMCFAVDLANVILPHAGKKCYSPLNGNIRNA